MGINSSFSAPRFSDSKSESFKFKDHDLHAIQDLAYNELNQIPLDEDLTVVNTALGCLVKNEEMDSKLEAKLSPSIKTRVTALQQILNDGVELSYVRPEDEKEFKKVILNCVQKKIKYFDQKQKQLEKLTKEYEKTKLFEMKDQLAEMDPKLQEETLKSIQAEALQKAKEEISKSQKEDQKIYLEQKAAFDAKKAKIGRRAPSTKNLYDFIKKERDRNKIGAEWPMEALFDQDSVIAHYLTLNHILSREDFLKLKVFEFLQLGKESLQPVYQKAKEESNQPTLTVEQMKLIVEHDPKQKLIKKIEEGDYKKLSELIADYTNDREVMLAVVKRSGILLRLASKELRGDRDLVLEALKQEGQAFSYISEELKRDKKVILTAVKNSEVMFLYAPPELRGNKEFILKAVRRNGMALKYIANELKNDKEFILQSVKQHEKALQAVLEDLKNDKDIVLAAVSCHGRALRYASEKLQDDREVVLAAVRQNGEALYWASEKLQKDGELKRIAYESLHRLDASESEI